MTLQQLNSVAAVRQDPWGNGYVYRYPGKKDLEGYDLFSSGPDHTRNTLDDDWGEPCINLGAVLFLLFPVMTAGEVLLPALGVFKAEADPTEVDY